MWGDNCSAQNKNWQYFFYMAYLIRTGRFTDVDLKFLLKDHSWMRPDGVFGHINNQLRQATVETPLEYLSIVHAAGAVGNFMEQTDFIDMSSVLNGLFTQRKTDVSGAPLDNITTYAWYRFTKTDAREVVMMLKKSTDITALWTVVSIKKVKGQVENPLEECDRPYCVLNEEQQWTGKKQIIKYEIFTKLIWYRC